MAQPNLPLLEELSWRGLLHQVTAQADLEKHLASGSRTGYCGFDPTSDSLTIGNLLPILQLRRFQQAGHKPIVLMGGGTGLIGDPSGKDAERALRSRDQILGNVAAQRKIFERLIDLDAAEIVNNADWLEKLGFIEVLRDVGKHFSINAMIQRDSVRDRLTQREQGISYTEFSYMLLQAYDYLHLYRTKGVTIQLAGSDQYGNIVSGIDLIHRSEGAEAQAFALTNPLLTKADGKKIGKTEKGAIWLSPERTSPYAFYQYFLNADDADVISFLKWYTMRTEAEISELAQRHQAAPEQRHAQRELARDITRLVHGDAELTKAEAASAALFSGDVRSLAPDLLAEVFADVPHTQHAKAQLEGEGLAVLELLPQTSLASSKREARQFLEAGAVLVNGEKATLDQKLTRASLLHGQTILLKRGKKQWHATRWE
ncbi:MAG TPA: tyrosine--tRNA ligase [Polyangiales bacterium]|nr:tyrosine--tRNA ligase [Polyangiales bacterium]